MKSILLLEENDKVKLKLETWEKSEARNNSMNSSKL